MTKKKPNWFMRILTTLFIIFMALFILNESGYYEAKVSRSVSLTNDAIKQFEEDVLNGKIVDVNTYIETDNNDYSNLFTKTGDKVSNAVGEFLSGGLNNVWEVFKVLFT